MQNKTKINQDDTTIEDLEIELLLQAIYRRYGYDFRDYSRPSIKRRLKHRLTLSGLATITDLQREILHNLDFFQLLLQDLSINVTAMFRDPTFYKTLKQKILPSFAQHEIIKIWHAGCASGEEVYSMAIFLKEANLYERARIYATDFNIPALNKAKEGIYPANLLKTYIKNYRNSGGVESFTDYYSAHYELVLMNKSLKKNIVFANHNLVTDGVFGEMDMILCRNVLIYFGRKLQDRVFKLFKESLRKGGLLCLGSKETIRISKYSDAFTDIAQKDKIYQKKV